MKLQPILLLPVMLIFSFLLFVSPVSAQDVIAQGPRSMSQGEKNSFYMELPTNNTKMSVEVWKDLMKEYKAKTKLDKKSKELFTDDATMTDISDNTVDVYARIDDNGITVWYDLGGAYLDTALHGDKVPAVKQMLFTYHHNLSKMLAVENVKAREAELKDLDKELKKLENEEKDLNDEIRKAKEAIAKAEKGLEVNAEMQQAKKGEISGKQEELKDAKLHQATLKKKKIQ